MSRRKKRRRRRPGTKPEVLAASAELDECLQACAELGYDLVVNRVECRNGTTTAHWMFNDGGARMLDWWPGSGRYWSKQTGERGKVGSASEALGVAMRIAKSFQR